jgi:hypothetical protein
MSTVKRLMCDECGKFGPDAMESEDPIKLARDDGWVVCGDADHITDRCPACTKDLLRSTMLHVICTDLNNDMEMHIGEATGKWHLDPGKLVAAIERHGMSLIQGKGDEVRIPADKLMAMFVGKTIMDKPRHSPCHRS